MNLVDFAEIADGETRELFASEFLASIGFSIVSPPSRGPDLGKDLLISETISGRLGDYQFRWLVSCKHFSRANHSVGLTDEPDIVERVKSFHADGFLGFYSTLPSSSLTTRFEQLKLVICP
jgi:hypothetical protein